MYKVGLFSPKLKPFGGLENLVKLLGDPELAYRSVSRYSVLFDQIYKFKTTAVSDNKVRIEASLPAGYEYSKNCCYFSQGILAAIPTLWGLPPAEVREEQCICAAGIPENKRACIYEVTWQALPPPRKRLWGNPFRKESDVSSAFKKLEKNFRILDKKNAELTGKNRQLAKVREMALALDETRAVDQIYRTVVEMARDIPGVRCVIVLGMDETGEKLLIPYHSSIRSSRVDAALKAIGFDMNRVLQANPGGKFDLSLIGKKLGRGYWASPRVIEKNTFAELLEGVWPKPICDVVQRTAGIRKVIMVPIIMDGESRSAILFCLSEDVNRDILEMVSVHCSSALKNAIALEKLERQKAELAALNRIANSISRSLDINSLLDSGLGEIISIYRANAAVIYLWDEEAQGLKLATQKGIPEEKAKKLKRLIGRGSLLCDFFLSGEEILSGKLSDHIAEYSDHNLCTGRIPIYFITAVLYLRSKRKGILTVVRESDSQFSERENMLLGSIVNQLAVAIENSDLHADIVKRMTEAENARTQLQEAFNRQRHVENELKQSQAALLESEQRFKSLYEQEKQECQELAEESKARAQFINVLAHELRTPLTPILLSVETLNSLLPYDPENIQSRLINNTLISAQSLKARLEELLDLARYSRGTFKLNLQLIQTGPFLERIGLSHLPAIEQKHQRLEMWISPGLPEVKADPSRLEQVLLNLLSNASKYSPENTVVQFKAALKDYCVMVEVKDQGIGIAQEDMKSLFIPYHRGEQDSAVLTRYRFGTGSG
jgi:signal transduction histidine kinase